MKDKKKKPQRKEFFFLKNKTIKLSNISRTMIILLQKGLIKEEDYKIDSN